MAAPHSDRQLAARLRLDSLYAGISPVYVIHYACQALDQSEKEGTPRVTAVGLRHIATGEATAFSIHAEAELQRLSPVQVLTRMDRLELLMLEKLFAFFDAQHQARFVHWNMRDEVYGFQAIALRYGVLGGAPQSLPGTDRIDLARLLADLFGASAGSGLHLASLARVNGLPAQGLLRGKAEADAFEHGQYAAVKRSTLTKVRLISDILSLAHEGALRVKFPTAHAGPDHKREKARARRHVFVSHASEDAALVGELVPRLEARGHPCWFAPRDITPGSDYQRSIVEAIEGAEAMVVVVSEAANDSIHIAREVNLADEEMKPILPLSVAGAKPRGSLRYQLNNRQWIELADLNAAIERLIHQLDARIAA